MLSKVCPLNRKINSKLGRHHFAHNCVIVCCLLKFNFAWACVSWGRLERRWGNEMLLNSTSFLIIIQVMFHCLKFPNANVISCLSMQCQSRVKLFIESQLLSSWAGYFPLIVNLDDNEWRQPNRSRVIEKMSLSDINIQNKKDIFIFYWLAQEMPGQKEEPSR